MPKFLLLIYLLSLGNIHQLAKVPLLFSHYSEHASDNNTLSFLEFLHMHYADHHQKDTHDDTDDELPFKSHSDCIGHLMAPAYFEDRSKMIPEPEERSSADHLFFSDLNLSTGMRGLIWQPPKV